MSKIENSIEAQIALVILNSRPHIEKLLDAIVDSAESQHTHPHDIASQVWRDVNYALQMVVCESFERVKEFRECGNANFFEPWVECLRETLRRHVEHRGCRKVRKEIGPDGN